MPVSIAPPLRRLYRVDDSDVVINPAAPATKFDREYHDGGAIENRDVQSNERVSETLDERKKSEKTSLP